MRRTGPARRPHRRTGPEDQLERDLDEVLDRLPPDRLLPERDDFARPELDRLELDRDALAREPLDLLEPDLLVFDRDALARVRDEDDPLDLRDAEDRPPDPLFDLLDELLRDLLDEPLRELVDRPFEELRELLDERRELERRRELPPLRRSAAGISSRATAFASCSICFSRNFAIRSSSRRMERASFAVSLSPTVAASDSIPA
jgi:hypothetical protein